MRKTLCFLLVLLIGVVFVSPRITITVAETSDDWVFDLGQFRDKGYYRVLESWQSVYHAYQGTNLDYAAIDYETNQSQITFEDSIAVIEAGQSFTFDVNIMTTARYHIGLSYRMDASFSTSPTIDITVDHLFLFNEMNDLPLPVKWHNEIREESQRYNRFGNELLPRTISNTGWYDEALVDPNGRYDEPLWFLLEAGTHDITITANNQDIRLDELTLFGIENQLTYTEYQALNEAYPTIEEEVITIEGQSIESKNDVEIKAGYYKGAGMSPSSYRVNLLNMLDGGSMTRSGMTVDYAFEVETAGNYKISLDYLQTDMVGMTSARRIAIDGEVPFQELNHYLFPYVKKWTRMTLGNHEGDYLFYLEAGEHVLSLSVTTAHLVGYVDELQQIMDRINSLGLAVSQITGNSSDALIDWDILKYLPNIGEDLNQLADQLDTIYDQINDLDKDNNRPTGISTLRIAAKQLRRLALYPNRIPNKLSEMNRGSGSAYQLIGIAINQLNNQPLSIDQIHIHGSHAELEKANANFFSRVWFSIKAFFYSFFDKRYRITSDPNDEVLDVWIGQSNLFLDIMQDLVDDEFTPDTGIDVRLSVLPNTQRIILNNATGTNPDVVLSIDSWEPYNFALRGMLADLSQFDGFDLMVQDYNPNNFTPMIFEEGVYGIPETQGISLMFYRTDILSFLGIDPPDTWEDVIHILPILQSYQMNFYHPLGGEGSYKGFGLTAPFIYQFGGEIYGENGVTTTFDEEVNIEAITFMTDIFNIYNLPQQVPSFFEHFRSGSLPVGISSVDLYLQLKYAAPELMGQWEMLPIPGMYDDTRGEVVRWSPSYGKASILFEASNMQEEGFQLIQWWNKKETQLRYLELIKMVLGERYLFLPANLETLRESIWDETVKTQALLQSEWSRIPAVTPGSYIIERELTNIWNKIVIDQVNPRVAIDESIPRINRELARKYDEFGYMEGGVVIDEYIVPRLENIWRWIPE